MILVFLSISGLKSQVALLLLPLQQDVAGPATSASWWQIAAEEAGGGAAAADSEARACVTTGKKLEAASRSTTCTLPRVWGGGHTRHCLPQCLVLRLHHQVLLKLVTVLRLFHCTFTSFHSFLKIRFSVFHSLHQKKRKGTER